MPLKSLQKVLIDELKDLYSAEQQIIKAMPKIAKAVSSPQLVEALQMHLEQTRGQLERLNAIARTMGEKEFKGKKCKAMEGLLEEGQELISEGGDPAVLDAALIGAAQKVEHYEIAAYGTARTHARHLGLEKVAQLLQATLDEEGMADKNLTKLAQKKINLEAQQADGQGSNGRTGRGSSRQSSKSSRGSRTSTSSKTTSSRKAMPRTNVSRTSRSTAKVGTATGGRGSGSRGGSRSSGARPVGGEDVGRGANNGGMGGGLTSQRESEQATDMNMNRQEEGVREKSEE